MDIIQISAAEITNIYYLGLGWYIASSAFHLVVPNGFAGRTTSYKAIVSSCSKSVLHFFLESLKQSIDKVLFCLCVRDAQEIFYS